MTEWTENFFGALYAEIYGEFLLSPERAVEEASFASQVLDLGRRTVLDLAAGFGRHSRLLARSNKVIAIDKNIRYLEAARRDLKPGIASNLCPVRADMRQLPLSDSRIDAAILLFNSFGYFTTPAPEPPRGGDSKAPRAQMWKLPQVFYDRKIVDSEFGKFKSGSTAPGQNPASQNGMSGSSSVPAESSAFDAPHSIETSETDQNAAVLQEVARCLKPGGEFLIELPNPTVLLDVIADAPRRVMISGDFEVHEQFQWHEEQRVLSNVTLFKKDGREESGEYRLRLYNVEEISQMLDDAGFRVVRKFGDYDGSRFLRAQSDVLILHAKKRSRSR